jgi:hypothetical protein
MRFLRDFRKVKDEDGLEGLFSGPNGAGRQARLASAQEDPGRGYAIGEAAGLILVDTAAGHGDCGL